MRFVSILVVQPYSNTDTDNTDNINLRELLNAETILFEDKQGYDLNNNWRDKGFHTFPWGIYLKVKLIARLEIELAYLETVI